MSATSLHDARNGDDRDDAARLHRRSRSRGAGLGPRRRSSGASAITPATPRSSTPRSTCSPRPGFDGMTIDMVAARAKAGKATIYRRWPSKADLVLDAVACMKAGELDAEHLPDTGTLRGDLVAMIRPRSIEEGERKLRIMGGLFGMISSSPELADAAHAAIIEPRVAVNRLFLRRAIERGEISADCDVETLAVVTPAMAAFRLLDPEAADRRRVPALAHRRGAASRGRRRSRSSRGGGPPRVARQAPGRRGADRRLRARLRPHEEGAGRRTGLRRPAPPAQDCAGAVRRASRTAVEGGIRHWGRGAGPHPVNVASGASRCGGTGTAPCRARTAGDRAPRLHG